MDDILKREIAKAKVRLILKIISVVMGFVAMGLALKWFGWKFAFVLFLALWSNNLCE